MKNPIQKKEDLQGGKLSEIMCFYLLKDDESRKKFSDLAAKSPAPESYAELGRLNEEYFGYPIKTDQLELEGLMDAYFRAYESYEAKWDIRNAGIYSAEALKKLKPEKNPGKFTQLVRLLTGMEKFAKAGTGDSAFLSILPNSRGETEIIYYDGETENAEGGRDYGLSQFVSTNWDTYLDEKKGRYFSRNTAETKKALKEYEKAGQSSLKKAPAHANSITLFKRCYWLLGHPLGKPTFEFAQYLEYAPCFDVYLKEKKLLTSQPVLANYWMLAHFFLSNRAACRETTQLILNSDSSPISSRGLAQHVSAALLALEKKPEKAALGKVSGANLTALLEETRRNATPELLEPELRKALQKERGEDTIQTLSKSELTKRLKDGADPWELMKEFPRDVATHDLLLKKMERDDKDLARIIKSYFKERPRDPSNKWFYRGREDRDFDPRLSLPAAAAFISGLKYDAEHKQAFSGVTRAFKFFDDDHAMEAYSAALHTLGPEDDRLEYVLKGLDVSEHPRRYEILQQGAWRLFDVLETTRKNQTKQDAEREAEPIHLDNIWALENHYLEVMARALNLHDEEALKLARRVTQETKLKPLQLTFGQALRVLGQAGDKETIEIASRFVNELAATKTEEDTDVGDIALYNFVEAFITWTKLEPKKAIPRAKELFEQKTKSSCFDLDLKSGLLYPLLADKPEDKTLLALLHRLIANQDDSPRLVGALRTAGEFKRTEFLDLMRRHSYRGKDSLSGTGTLSSVVARGACMDMGLEDLPEFDNSDRDGSDLKGKEVPPAFQIPHKYVAERLCGTVRKKGLQGPAIREVLGNYLKGVLFYSADTPECRRGVDPISGLKALRFQKEAGIPVLNELFDVEGLNTDHYATLLYVMGTMEAEAKVRERVYALSKSELMKELEEPSAVYRAWLDLLGARLLVLENNSGEAVDAVEGAFRRRIQFAGSGWESQEPTLVGLSRLMAACGRRDLLKEFQAKLKKQGHSLAVEVLTEALKRDFFEDDSGKKSKWQHLANHIKGDEDRGPVYTLKFAREGETILFKCQVDCISFQGIVPDGKLESEGSFTTESEEAAKTLMEQILQEGAFLGYKPVLKKAKAGV